MALPFSASRIVILAPHPDDDVIAAGGFIQRSLAAHSDVHVVFITDGENNPWPQRYTHKRVFIGAGRRREWGHLRRREALASLACLGVPESSTRFLAFPDQGISRLARSGDMRLRGALQDVIRELQPSLIVSPSYFDLHADHRAIAWFAHKAAPDAEIVTFVIHGNGPANRLAYELDLTLHEKGRKLEAIECHATQLLLSRNRFLSYAHGVERFYRAEHDVVRIDSAARDWWCGLRHSMRALFGVGAGSGVQPTADVEHRPGDVPGVL